MKEPIKTGRITPKVSQKTIDEIKKMGMTNALKLVKMYASQGKGLGKEGAAMRKEGQNYLRGEQAEGVRRLYGDRRYNIATGVTKPSTKKKPSTSKPKYTSPDAARKK